MSSVEADNSLEAEAGTNLGTLGQQEPNRVSDESAELRLGHLRDTLLRLQAKIDTFAGRDAKTASLVLNRVETVLGKGSVAAQRLVLLAAAYGLERCLFRRCPAAYYTWTLEQRRQFLEPAPTVYHLCKSLILENTRANVDDEASGPGAAPRYVCVILPYPARLHTEKVTQAVRCFSELCQLCPAPRSQVHYQVAPAEQCQRITGYGYNAVTPLGMRTPMPILVASVLEKWLKCCRDDCFWLGGGATDLKLNVSLSDFVRVFSRVHRLPVLIRDITY